MALKIRNHFPYTTNKKKTNFPFFLTAIILIIIYTIIILVLPTPKLTPTNSDLTTPKSSLGAISWPKNVQMAVGAENYGVLLTTGEQKSSPIASIAKTILALAVLEQKPLEAGQQGPILTMTANDLELFNTNFAQNGSVVPVRLNEELTEYQMLQALLIPSGDNIADTLAIWAFGSIDNYLNYASKMVAGWNLDQTHVADASGLSPQTVSSASNLVTLGEKVIKHPVLKEIVGQSQVDLPVVGVVKNYNTLIGKADIFGIKTGNTDEAGGCFLFAAKKTINSKEVNFIGAILGDTSRNQALIDTRTFVEQNASQFEFVNAVSAGQEVGFYKTPWGETVNVVAKDNLPILMAGGEKVTLKVNLNEISKSMKKGSEVGTITAELGSNKISVPAILENKISRPPFTWRLFHP